MQEFYITFGQKYRRQPHPKGGHPDGWFVVEADTKANAELIVKAELGMEWSNCYEAGDFKDRSLYPRGELGRIQVYLIESAPDLLEACKAAKEYIGVYHDASSSRAPTLEVYEKLKAAIAKAEGEV